MQVANYLILTFTEPCRKGSKVNCMYAAALSAHSYLLSVSELAADFFREMDEKVAADTGSLRAKQLDKLLSCPNPKVCIPWPFPPVFCCFPQENNKKQWGFYSVLLAVTRDPAKFGGHCWSNTAQPPQSSTTYVASQMPFPLLPLPQGCLYKATHWQQQMPIRTVSQSFATQFDS